MKAEEKERLRKFLIDAMIPDAELERTMRLHGVSELDLARWMQSRLFRRLLKRVFAGLTARSELEVARGTVTASRRLAERAGKPLQDFDELCRKVCVDLVKLNRSRDQRKRNSAVESTPPTLIAPDVPRDEGESLLEQLRALRARGRGDRTA